ncbi:hypothetical protein GJU40_16110 [Bacillus lacus]|uniref:SbsC C-terminal domain-containing protein n=1 Tax=Metabacillus lacus TaxID=1983721 RepID=A0A7X2J1C2_9BACI|nr:hypothetical protein [Metabacillus lacus]MRX73667.1 hypothetical protein [Metabacillus lacus]
MKRALLTGISAAMLLSPLAAVTATPASASAVTASVAATPAYKEAVKQGNTLAKGLKNYSAAVTAGDIDRMDMLFDGVSKQLRVVESSIGKVAGPGNRAELLGKYVTPAKKELERTMYEVSQFRLALKIYEKITGGDVLYWHNNITHRHGYKEFDADLLKLERLKKRAAAIKKAGNYSPLPSLIYWEIGIEESMAASVNLLIYNLKFEYFLDEEENIFEAELYYDDFTRYLKHKENLIEGLPPIKDKTGLYKVYVQSARSTIERIKYEVSQIRLLKRVEELAKAGRISEAKAELSKLRGLRQRAALMREESQYKPLPAAVDADIHQYEQKLRTSYQL